MSIKTWMRGPQTEPELVGGGEFVMGDPSRLKGDPSKPWGMDATYPASDTGACNYKPFHAAGSCQRPSGHDNDRWGHILGEP